MRDSKEKSAGAGKDKDSRWPFVVIYFVMWASMIGNSLNGDPIKLDLNFPVVFGLVAILVIVIFIAASRYYGHSPFAFPLATISGNLAWHIFILTGIVFISFVFFASAAQIMILEFNAPIFQSGCSVSQRDVALFVWEAMAKGALKFVANYVPVPAGTCVPDTGARVTAVSALIIRWFTALVLVWYFINLGKSWYLRARSPHRSST